MENKKEIENRIDELQALANIKGKQRRCLLDEMMEIFREMNKLREKSNCK
tara:strand:- start:13201 stop:13350 length:150 start_codon:yes stop_codon:yes gene_type:complete